MISDFEIPIPSLPLILPRFSVVPFVSSTFKTPSSVIVTLAIPIPSLPSTPLAPSLPSAPFAPSLPSVPLIPSLPSFPTIQPRLILDESEKASSNSPSEFITTLEMPMPSLPS